MSLNPQDQERVRSALGVLVDIAPLGRDFDELVSTSVEPLPSRPHRTGLIAALAFAAVMVVIAPLSIILFNGDPSNEPADPVLVVSGSTELTASRLSWEATTVSPDAGPVNHVVWLRDRFILTTDSGRWFQSSDGTEWEEYATLGLDPADDIQGLIVGSGGLVAAGFSQGDHETVWQSADGTTWTSIEIPWTPDTADESKPFLMGIGALEDRLMVGYGYAASAEPFTGPAGEGMSVDLATVYFLSIDGQAFDHVPGPIDDPATFGSTLGTVDGQFRVEAWPGFRDDRRTDNGVFTSLDGLEWEEAEDSVRTFTNGVQVPPVVEWNDGFALTSLEFLNPSADGFGEVFLSTDGTAWEPVLDVGADCCQMRFAAGDAGLLVTLHLPTVKDDPRLEVFFTEDGETWSHEPGPVEEAPTRYTNAGFDPIPAVGGATLVIAAGAHNSLGGSSSATVAWVGR